LSVWPAFCFREVQGIQSSRKTCFIFTSIAGLSWGVDSRSPSPELDFYGTRRFINVFNIATPWTLLWARLIRST
jgi:hypothetical protein